MQRREEPQLHGAGHTLLEGFDAHDLVIGAVYRDAEVQPFGSPVSVVPKPIFAAPAIVSNIDCVISLLALRNYLWIIPVSERLHLGGKNSAQCRQISQEEADAFSNFVNLVADFPRVLLKSTDIEKKNIIKITIFGEGLRTFPKLWQK